MKLYFRDMLIFDYDEEKRFLSVPMDEDTGNANLSYCKWAPGDEITDIAEFFGRVIRHQRGQNDVCLNDMRVY